MLDRFLHNLEQRFPIFAAKLRTRPDAHVENVKTGARDDDLAQIESSIGIPLPESYKQLLRCGREFWLFGGAIQFGFQHPFTHDFQPYDKLTPQQQQSVRHVARR